MTPQPDLQLCIAYTESRSFDTFILQLLLQAFHGDIFGRQLLLQSSSLSAHGLHLYLSVVSLCRRL